MAGRRRALIVANDVYENEGLTHLLAPGADAEALAAVLGDPEIGGFDVHVVRNEPSYVIQGQIEDLFSDSRPEDVLLLHFSCHGLKNESGELFFAARNTRPNRLGSSAISADFVQRCMRASRSRSIVLLLDCCYGGAFSRGVTVRAAGDINVLDSFPGGRLGGGRGRAVITASSAVEYAFEGDRLADDQERRPSVFTSALVDGLATGDADRDQDGWVSLNELYDYVFDRVRELNPHQTPSRDVEMQGELYLARRSRPVTTPSPLPPDLQGVIDNPLANVRAGAVQELARLERGSHAGLALAARQALESLANDDSRMVAAAAAEALASIPSSPEAPAQAPAPAPSSSGASAGGSPPRRPTGQWVSHAFRQHRRLIYAAAAAAVLAIAAVTAVVLLKDPDAPTAELLRPGEEFTATSPWRLVIRDNRSGPDGCDVTVTKADGGEEVATRTDVYGGKSFQLRLSGKFRWEANSPECSVSLNPGFGEAELPFTHYGGADTDAFEANGPVAVEVLKFSPNPECKFSLYDAEDGRQLASGSLPEGGGRLLLNPGGESKVYINNYHHCDARLSAG